MAEIPLIGFLTVGIVMTIVTQIAVVSVILLAIVLKVVVTVVTAVNIITEVRVKQIRPFETLVKEIILGKLMTAPTSAYCVVK